MEKWGITRFELSTKRTEIQRCESRHVFGGPTNGCGMKSATNFERTAGQRWPGQSSGAAKSRFTIALARINQELWLVLSLFVIAGLFNWLVASHRMILGLYT